MAFGSFEDTDDGPLNEINMVPLIDVMLVLLIIFIITAPLMTNAVKVDLPKQQTEQNQIQSTSVTVSINEKAEFFWNDEKIDHSQLKERFANLSKTTPDVEVQIRADRNVGYGHVAEVMAEASRQQLTKIGFVTDPSSNPNP